MKTHRYPSDPAKITPIDLERHGSCQHYANTERTGFVTTLQLGGKTCQISSQQRMLLLFVEGTATSYFFSGEKPVRQTGSYMVVVDRETTICIHTYQRARISYFFFDKPVKLCECFSLSRLKPYVPSMMVHTIMPLLLPVKLALDAMVKYAEDGLSCSNITESKFAEVLFAMSAYYHPEDLGRFLAPLLSQEVSFKEFVLKNFNDVSTVQELADLSKMPLRLFNKMFMDTFEMTPYQWILQQRGELIKQRLLDPKVSFADIIKEFKFSSPSHFTVYSRKQFGMTPSALRRQLLQEGRPVRSRKTQK